MATVANYWLQPRPAFAQVHRLLCVVCHALQVVTATAVATYWRQGLARVHRLLRYRRLVARLLQLSDVVNPATVPEGVEVSYCSGSKGGGMDGWQVVRQ